MSQIWILGTSLCLPFNLENASDGWPSILSRQLGLESVNLAQPAVDNFFIYHCYREHFEKIQNTDIVIIGWSHYSRKIFELDRSNPNQMDMIEHSLVYKTKQHEFIRSNNQTSGVDRWINHMFPVTRGLKYYDNWYNNYYSAYEQKCHLQSFLDSVHLTCPAPCLHFFFSKESIENVNISRVSSAGFMAEFIKENNVAIDVADAHLNLKGHRLWADHLMQSLDKVI